jgi:pimeloyl-ACP methyl ester carboxylesterase
MGISIHALRRRLNLLRALLLGLLLSVSLLAADAPAADPPPLGRLVDLGGYRLHLHCTGKGKPTVVFSNGAGDFSFDWYLVQTKVSEFTRACSYDRGGEAWSDLGPRPHTIFQEAHDLERLLARGGEEGPFVMVGQSAGSTIVRVFWQEYPREVVGMVLVDGFHEDARLFINGKLVKVRDLSKHRPMPPVRDSVADTDKLTDAELAEIKSMIQKYEIKPTIDPPFEKLPPEIQKLRRWALSRDTHFVAMDDDYGPEESALMYDLRHKTEHPLGSLPVIVLSRSRNEYPKNVAEQMTKEHEAQQADLTALSANSKQVVVPESGHHIQLDQPAAVIAAIQGLVNGGPHIKLN